MLPNATQECESSPELTSPLCREVAAHVARRNRATRAAQGAELAEPMCYSAGAQPAAHLVMFLDPVHQVLAEDPPPLQQPGGCELGGGAAGLCGEESRLSPGQAHPSNPSSEHVGSQVGKLR